jgi:hypothetical protein
MKITVLFVYSCLLMNITSTGQSISSSIPKSIGISDKYLFYQHGQLITDMGNNAINLSFPKWGPYEYTNILDSLKTRGFNVISEMRQRRIPDSIYVNKISKQIDSLLVAGVLPGNILVVGASSGWDISLRVSFKLKNPEIRYVLLGGCWPDTYNDYLNIELYGHFLSIIEFSDSHDTCSKIFNGRTHLTSYKEIRLNTGMGHGFLFKGYKVWINPVVAWFEKR